MGSLIRHVLVATDFGPASANAVTYAAAIARGVGARLHLVHVLEQPFVTSGPYELHLPDTPVRHERRYQLAVAKLRRVAADLDGVDTSVEVRDGTAAAALVKAATDYGADLILLGTYEHGAMQHWIASGLDERLRRDAPCPVLAVRQ